ncbi:protein FAM111A-like isoform X2 [Sinocyclocheilus rhinocerous]|uniref:Serine protease n=3 Tax=Sinocyclocheilus rhinocerous TaxID=307959 RepID=A0A673I740_9TELE|nr:PREDICTED: protein FAM111A-like isoform X2 [Sinocyclocheilus rhinocerous]
MDNLCKKEAEERPSKVLKQERMDDSCEKAASSKYDPQQSAEGQSHPFHFRYKSKKHAVECDTSKTVLDALNTNKTFRKMKKDNMDKEIVIQRSKGAVPRAAVKTDFPCCLIENDELLDITFIKNSGNVPSKKKTTGRPSVSSESENLVTFNIKTKGGKKVKCLMKNNKLRMKVDDVCVYAFKEDKLKAALQRDGRFTNVLFQKRCALSELGSETIYEMSHAVKHLDGKHFEIIVISDKNQPDSQDVLSDVSPEMNEAAAADLKEDPNQHPNTEQSQMRNTMKSTNTSTNSLKIIPDPDEILQILRNQYKVLVNALKKREKLKDSQVQTFFRAEYDKSVQSFSEVKKVKQLMRFSDSVCQIRVEGSARGTGFLLFDRFILTNAHVIGEFDPFTRKLSKTLTAVFGYEDLEAKETKCVLVKEHVAKTYYGDVEIDKHLDYALLELQDTDEITGCPELLSYYSPGPPPNRGGICIVGHPDGGIKRMDPCFIIEREDLQVDMFIHMMRKRSFENKWHIHGNQITYDSCFFEGSSGSPVFDEDCKLIGIHTGGYWSQTEGKKSHFKEFAYSLQAILDDIEAKLGKIVIPVANKSNVSKQYNQINYEMEETEES